MRWLVVLLVACGGAQKPAQPAVPTCDQVADGMVSNMRATQEHEVPGETIDMIKDIIRTACGRDAWSDAAKRCMATMKKTPEDADRCSAQLTDEQLKALIRDEESRIPKR